MVEVKAKIVASDFDCGHGFQRVIHEIIGIDIEEGRPRSH